MRLISGAADSRSEFVRSDAMLATTRNLSISTPQAPTLFPPLRRRRRRRRRYRRRRAAQLTAAAVGRWRVPLSRQIVLRARMLRSNAGYIPGKAFRLRRHYFNNEDNGLLHVPKGAASPQAQMLTDPNMAMDMMKKNLGMIIPQTLTFAWVNFFFSGFVAAKIPFPLTQRFRPMLQNGIDLSSVDVCYVSSRSWYFLNLFGLRGFFSLILGEDNAVDDTQRMMQMQMASQMGGFGADPGKTLTGEKDGLDLLQHEWLLPQIEQRAEATLKRLLEAS
eukprot:SM000376S13706  [mRNA]  locus=s376:59055:61006:- [translate_table: standard]